MSAYLLRKKSKLRPMSRPIDVVAKRLGVRAVLCRFLSLRLLVLALASNAQTSPSSPWNKQALTDFAMRNAGDPTLGRALFADEKRLACSKCHSTDGSAEKAGPDLSGIGDKFPRSELIRSILEPSDTIAVGYGTTIVQTKDGETVEGVIKQATESSIELIGADGKPARIAMADIADQRTSDVSLMPQGLETGLTPQDFANLIAYLESLHQPLAGSAHIQGMPEAISQATRSVDLVRFFDGNVRLNHPTWFGQVLGFTNRFVALEQGGKSWIIEHAAAGDQQSLLVDLSPEVRVGGATGLLALAFHPRFCENRRYYLKYQLLQEGRIVTRFVERRFSPDFRGDAGQPRILLEIPAVTQDHNGGALAFGPDGFLYFGMGDSGPQRDPQGHGQNLNTLLGKILRLDVDHADEGRAYSVPKDNPFMNRPGVKPEIWAYGFREPWRMSFDRVTGDLWVGDVGQDRVEEITLVRAAENHGWNVFEGHTPFSDQYRRGGEIYTPPVFSYSHRLGVSVTGGCVYRGRCAPQMQGQYICGDFETRRLWALTHTNRSLASIIEIGRAPTRVVSFTEDYAGELYIVGYDAGLIYRMDLAGVDLRPRQWQVIAATSEENPVLWRYTLEPPTNGWIGPEFDDSAWRLSPAGFGTRETPGSVVRTEWRSSDIWLRRIFNFTNLTNESQPRSLALRLHHDEDCEIYLNGVQIATEPRWTTSYIELPLGPEASKALRSGRNVLTVHCHQTSGGQYIDAGLLEYVAQKPHLGRPTEPGASASNP
jgi:putative heme-binding domain-containing protein